MWGGGGRGWAGPEKDFTFGINIWISHEIRSILSVGPWGNGVKT